MDNTDVPKLEQLGLTKQEVAAYLALLKEGNLTAREVAQKVGILPNAVYRTCRKLSEVGFVTLTHNYPTKFHAVAKQTAAVAYANKKIEALEKLSSELGGSQLPIGQDSNPTDINLIYGAENIYEEGAKLLDSAKQEMLVISIGEPITPNLLLAVKNARERGVTIKMIVHKYDEENQTVLENFKKNGYIIRHFPGWGFHMAIYDRGKTLLIINNPENINERAAMLISSKGLSKALSDYFNSTWKKAKKI